MAGPGLLKVRLQVSYPFNPCLKLSAIASVTMVNFRSADLPVGAMMRAPWGTSNFHQFVRHAERELCAPFGVRTSRSVEVAPASGVREIAPAFLAPPALTGPG